MAKEREERYAHTEDMLEDLRAVRNNQPPTHARRIVDLDSLAQVEETGKTVDISVPKPSWTEVFNQPAFVVVVVAAGISVLINLIFLVVALTRH